uniref:Uncharacterized protein n=1 Tax=Oryza meridionalis TaxID=40149 RepID=A0A0E0BW09_9ORYZ
MTMASPPAPPMSLASSPVDSSAAALSPADAGAGMALSSRELTPALALTAAGKSTAGAVSASVSFVAIAVENIRWQPSIRLVQAA